MVNKKNEKFKSEISYLLQNFSFSRSNFVKCMACNKFASAVV